MTNIPIIVSESSYATGVEDQADVVERATQTKVPTKPSRHNHPTSKLQRHHTSDHIYDFRKPNALRNPSRAIRSRLETGLSDSYPFIVGKAFTGDSGYISNRRSHPNSPWERSESPVISLTPPISLDYLVARGGSSPAGSLTPNGIHTSRSNGNGVFLNPGYLQSPYQCNQSTSDTGGPIYTTDCPCRIHCDPDNGGHMNGGHPMTTSEGLSWRRLHMSRAKLKATATTSELLSGFAMVAMVELQINEPTNVPEWLFVMFAVCTTVLVAVHIFALMISTYLLPNIDAISKMESPVTGALRDSPHERMRGFIELAWAFSTVLGLFLFLVEVAILCWVKFWDYSFAAATAATVIVIPVLVVFVAFAIHFYHSLVVHKVRSSGEDMQQLENMKRDLDTATVKINLV